MNKSAELYYLFIVLGQILGRLQLQIMKDFEGYSEKYLILFRVLE